MTSRFILFIVLCAAGLRLIFNASAESQAQRTGYELCTEVAYEVALSVEAGILDQGRADQIIDRCFELYGGDK